MSILPSLPELKPPDLNQLKFVLLRNMGINPDYNAFIRTLTAGMLGVPAAQFADFKKKLQEAGFNDLPI